MIVDPSRPQAPGDPANSQSEDESRQWEQDPNRAGSHLFEALRLWEAFPDRFLCANLWVFFLGFLGRTAPV